MLICVLIFVTLPVTVSISALFQYIRESELRDLDLSGPGNLEPEIVSRIGNQSASSNPHYKRQHRTLSVSVQMAEDSKGVFNLHCGDRNHNEFHRDKNFGFHTMETRTEFQLNSQCASFLILILLGWIEMKVWEIFALGGL